MLLVLVVSVLVGSSLTQYILDVHVDKAGDMDMGEVEMSVMSGIGGMGNGMDGVVDFADGDAIDY